MNIKRFSILVMVAALLVTFSMTSQASAWSVEQSASANCVAGNVALTGTFTNTEPSGSNMSMDVTMKTSYGNSGPKTVAPGATVNFVIQTGKASISSGTVTFVMTWTNGSKGDDSRTASYNATTCTTPPPPTTVPPTTPPTTDLVCPPELQLIDGVCGTATTDQRPIAPTPVAPATPVIAIPPVTG